jgi:hypothetical protein
MATFWKGIAVACLGAAALEGLVVAGFIVRAIRPASTVSHHAEDAAGPSALSLVIVIAVIGVLTGLRAYRRLSQDSPGFARLAATAVVGWFVCTLLLLVTAV